MRFTPAATCDSCGWEIVNICTNGDCPKPKPDLWAGVGDARDPLGWVPGMLFGSGMVSGAYTYHRFMLDPEETFMPRMGRRRRRRGA